MLKEIWHFVRHAPGVARLSFSMSQAELYDELIERSDTVGLAVRRAALVEDLSGDVLEIGCGTGRMLRHYPGGVRLIATEPAADFLKLAEERGGDSEAQVSFEVADAMDLPYEDGRFDAVVAASVLCSVPSVERILGEVKRVLKPAGRLRLIDHVLSDRAVPAALMHVFNPLWRLWNRQGCNMNRSVEAPLRAAGFTLVEVERFQIFAPGLPAFPSLAIKAVRE
ncbi:MAG: class I SAM-dependent methyltransferase [Planctomycetota bacterium]|nr:class I SAM-dependent methyltransferase [Planctomycetota bacterium]